MSCRAERLSALVDGELGARETARLRAHLEGCERCRAVFADLGRLKSALAAEAAHPPAPADRDGDGWAGLAARIGATPEAPRFAWRRSSLWLAPALGALVLALAGGAFLRHRARGSAIDDQLLAQAEDQFRSADAEYRSAIDKLRTVTERARVARGEPSPDEARRYAEAARALADAAAQCRKVAAARPADPDSEELLFAAYQKEISFYQDQLLRTAGGAR